VILAWMPSPEVALVMEMQAAFLGAEPARALAFFDPDVRWDASVRPDGKVWSGPQGVREAMTEWSSTWEEWELEVERYLDAGGGRVLALWRERGRGRGSQVPTEQRGANLFTVRDGRIVAVRVYVDQRTALAAAGLADR
jgi:ketosteroid isomerase-like protein